MGYARPEEIVSALNELLEAERAGARVALAGGKYRAEPDYAELMRDVRKDEARWCAMLSRHLKRLGAAPSRRTGAFHAKAMAVPEPWDRLAFLNRGQAWVVRKLETLTPRIRDDSLHADRTPCWKAIGPMSRAPMRCLMAGSAVQGNKSADTYI
jgi:hypothetical protein